MFKTIGTKVLAGILVCAFTGALTIYMVTTLGYEDLSDRNAKRMLSMMSESIFQTLRLSMFSGDRIVIEDTIKRASHIVGVHQLTIVPNQDVINTFDMNIKYTTDPNVLEVFNSKRSKWIETNNGKDHHVRMLKPLIAEPICLRCHFLSKTQDVLGVMDLDISLNTNDMMIRASQAKLGLFMIVALTIAVLFGVLFFRSFNRKLHTIQVGLLSFFSFLNHTKNRATRLSIDSNDELGQMAKVINKNISRIESGLIKDRHFISEATQIVVRLNSGFLSERLRADTDNHGLRALKEVINQMLTALHSNIKEILSVLNAYREDDYTALINSGALDGELRDLNNGINRLGESIGIMLSGNLENGQQLERNAKELGGYVQALSTATVDQAAVLADASKAVSAITDTIRENALKAGQMASIAEETQKSASEGSVLASRTQNAMEQIVISANAINEAITVIDAIAFQTNILSLNAAVEAATAGEAGKGFAVVAGEVRNLAARSAEAARAIKELAEESQRRAEEGKQISAQMMLGYTQLSGKISETSDLVSRVAQASVEQMLSIDQINAIVDKIGRMTGESADIAQKTHEVAKRTSDMARELVKNASGKKFRRIAEDNDEEFDLFEEETIEQLKELIESGFSEEPQF